MQRASADRLRRNATYTPPTIRSIPDICAAAGRQDFDRDVLVEIEFESSVNAAHIGVATRQAE